MCLYNHVFSANLVSSIYQQVECYEVVPPKNVNQYAFRSRKL